MMEWWVGASAQHSYVPGLRQTDTKSRQRQSRQVLPLGLMTHGARTSADKSLHPLLLIWGQYHSDATDLHRS